MAYPVFTFNGTHSSKQSPSIAHLVEEVSLPDKMFILCASVKMSRFDNVGFFSVLGEDSQYWIMMRFTTSVSNVVNLAVSWDDRYRILKRLKNPRLDYWYHICAKIDLENNEMEFALNGDHMGQVLEKNISSILNTSSL